MAPNAAKSLSTRLSDDYTLQSDPIEDGVTQTFSTDEDLLAIGFVFGTAGDQPAGALELTLADADTGEVLARSTGEMANIIRGSTPPSGWMRRWPAWPGGGILSPWRPPIPAKAG